LPESRPVGHPLLVEEPPPEHPLLFHYTSRDSLLAILDSGNLRLNTPSRMNDPRERTQWIPEKIVHPEGGVSPATMQIKDEVHDQIDLQLRLSARVACLTSDRTPSAGAGPGTNFHRGWGRARMWEQYGQQHRGAVLVFSRVDLFESFQTTIGAKAVEHLMWGSVDYRDQRLDLPLEGSFSSVDEVRVALEDLKNKGRNLNDLFFVKNSDWSGETEVRFLAVVGAAAASVDEPLDLTYGDSLRAVVLGERWDGSDWLKDAVARRRVSADDVVRCDWVNGAPALKNYLLR